MLIGDFFLASSDEVGVDSAVFACCWIGVKTINGGIRIWSEGCNFGGAVRIDHGDAGVLIAGVGRVGTTGPVRGVAIDLARVRSND